MLTLNDGRAELWQWDTGRTLAVDADCSQVHFSNKVFGRSIDVDVADGVSTIPDVLLQTDNDLNVWAFVGTAENGYTKISKTFKVNRRNKPADYVFTPTDQTTLAELSGRLDRIEESQDPDAIKNAVEDYIQQNPVEAPVQSVNGQTGAVELNAEDVGAIAKTELQTAINTALAQAKASGAFDGADGQPGENGADGYSPTANVTQNDNGATITITDKNGTTTATVTNGKDGADGIPGKDGADGKDGAPGSSGKDGITPTIGENGNWYLGDTDTGKPSRGETGPAGADGRDGADGQPGADGKSAYQYAVEGGYTGTEAAFAAKLAAEKLANPYALSFTGAVTGSYDGSEAVTVEIPSGGGAEAEHVDILSEGTLSEDVANIAVDGFAKRMIALAVAPYGSTANSGNIKVMLQLGLDNGESLTLSPPLNFVTNAASISWNKIVAFVFVDAGTVDVTVVRDGSSSDSNILFYTLGNSNIWWEKQVYTTSVGKITSVSIGLQSDGVIGKNTAYKVVGA